MYKKKLVYFTSFAFILTSALFIIRWWSLSHPMSYSAGYDDYLNTPTIWRLKLLRHFDRMEERDLMIENFEKKAPGVRQAYDLFEPDFDCFTKTRVGTRYWGDGPKFLCDVEAIPKPDKCLVYSVGSNGDFNFEESIRDNFNCETHTFDPTGSWPAKASRAHTTFHDIGLDNFVGTRRIKDKNCSVAPLDRIVSQLKHDGRMIDIFKIDCEGCEWLVFDQIWKDLAVERYRIGQILVEVHGTDFKKISPFFQKATKAGFLVFSKERNHWGCDGYSCLEYSLVHKSVAKESHIFYRKKFM